MSECGYDNNSHNKSIVGLQASINDEEINDQTVDSRSEKESRTRCISDERRTCDVLAKLGGENMGLSDDVL